MISVRACCCGLAGADSGAFCGLLASDTLSPLLSCGFASGSELRRAGRALRGSTLASIGQGTCKRPSRRLASFGKPQGGGGCLAHPAHRLLPADGLPTRAPSCSRPAPGLLWEPIQRLVLDSNQAMHVTRLIRAGTINDEIDAQLRGEAAPLGRLSDTRRTVPCSSPARTGQVLVPHRVRHLVLKPP